jgi:ankyrin repeat protein
LNERNPTAPETAENAGYLPLHYACRYKATLEVVQFLVKRNPTALKTANNNGWSPLHLACNSQAPLEAVQFLVERNPTALETTNNNGWSPLHLACNSQASLEVVQFLVERNPAALETADNGGWLPLHCVCCNKVPLEVVQFLVERNPTVLGMANISGELPFDIACRQEASLEFLCVLVERTPATVKTTDEGEEFCVFSWSEHPPLSKRRTKAKNCPRPYTLHAATGQGCIRCKICGRWLLGIDPSAVETANADGNLSLHLVCTAQASLAAVQILVERTPPLSKKRPTMTETCPCTLHATARHRWRRCSS